MKSIISVLALPLLLLLGACTKPAPDPVETAKALLTANHWKLTSTVMVTATGEQPQTVANCRKDNLWEYKADGSFAHYPGATTCFSGEKAYYGTWELVSGGAELKVTLSNGNTFTEEVVELENGKLVVRYTAGNVYIDTFISN